MVKPANSAHEWSVPGEEAGFPSAESPRSAHQESGAISGGDSNLELHGLLDEGPSLGVMVRERRLELGLTLAALSDRAGCAKGYLSQIETGVREKPPSEEVVSRLESALGFPRGKLAQIAAWHRVPQGVRKEVATHRRAARRLRQFIDLAMPQDDGNGEPQRGINLDDLHASGELRRLVDQIDPGGVRGRSPEGVSVEPVRLPREVPLINFVTAGQPTEFTDLGYPARVADDYVRVPDLADPDAFAARIVGDSMHPDYREGDVVVFSPAEPVRSGDDCFARLEPDQETTFKRVFFEPARDGSEQIRLQPLNSSYPPRTVGRETVARLYRAVTVMRQLPGADRR